MNVTSEGFEGHLRVEQFSKPLWPSSEDFAKRPAYVAVGSLATSRASRCRLVPMAENLKME